MAATVTATPYHGISLSGCEMDEQVLPDSAGRWRLLFYSRASALALALVRDRFHEMHHPRAEQGILSQQAVHAEGRRARWPLRLRGIIKKGNDGGCCCS